MSPPRVLFVCTGNICRSPAAHAVLVTAARRAGVPVVVDSAGLGGWHAGELPDPRAIAEGARRGYVLDHPARKVRPTDFGSFDLILAMDRTHLRGLAALAPAPVDHLVLFRTFDPTPGAPDVADPYYDGDAAFVEMFDVIEAAMPRLVARVGEIGGHVTRPSTL
jgi:protein-tyrosine phosphatase